MAGRRTAAGSYSAYLKATGLNKPKPAPTEPASPLFQEHGGEELGMMLQYVDLIDARYLIMLHEANGNLPCWGAIPASAKINKANITARLKEIKGETELAAEAKVLKQWLDFNKAESALKKAIKEADLALDKLAYEQYPQLSEAEIQTLAVNDKWLATLQQRTHSELDRITQALTQRVKELAERYEAPLPKMTNRVDELEARVNTHLEQMGFACN